MFKYLNYFHLLLPRYVVKCCEINENEELVQPMIHIKEINLHLIHDGEECINKTRNKFSIRVVNMQKLSECDDQDSLTNFKDEINREETTQNHSKGKSSRKRKNYWTEEDSVHLILILNNVGRK